MANGLNKQRLSLVFKSRPDILEGIQAAADTPARVKLFNNIASFVYEQIGDPASSEPALKRRRVEIEPSKNGTASNGTSAASSGVDVEKEGVLLEMHDISIAAPIRKKLDICITAQHIYARDVRTAAQRSLAPTPGMVWAWKDIEYAFYLPVPEKSQAQFHYVLFPRGSTLALPSKDADASKTEPLLLTIPATAPKPDAISGPNAAAAAAVSDTYSTLFHWAINKCLQATSNNVRIEAADPAKFHSMVRQAHRPNEKAVFVKAFRGTKEGYLFFLESGILFGFKKPLLLIPLDRIAAVSYVHVLQRTFNMVVEVFTEEGGDPEATAEIEFSMLDQQDYGGINETYVVRKGLQDRSMADQRKAKIELAENVKGRKKGAAAEGADGAAADEDATGGGLTELQRAEQELEDEEDEDEEDYDPGSEGDSEGSGSSSDEDDDEDADDGDEGDEDEDDE
jgi:hypothetical protein